MKRNNKPLSPAEVAKRLGISQEQFEAQAKKQVDEYLRIHRSALTSQERLELEKQAKASSSFDETYRRDAHRRCGVSIPFPLPDIYYYTTDGTVPADGVYDHDDPEYLEKLSDAAYGAINDYLMFFYKPGLYLNKEQLRIATDVALDIRAVYHDLKNIPLAENPDCPTYEDFIRLGQWFLDANTAIKAEIASSTTRTQLPSGGDAGDKKKLKPLSEKASAVLELLKTLPEHRGMTGPKILETLDAKRIHIDQSTLTKNIIPELKPYGVKNKPRIGYYIER